jgi:hypothetical protein
MLELILSASIISAPFIVSYGVWRLASWLAGLLVGL